MAKTVEGLITASGPAGVSSGKSWLLVFHLNPWRQQGGAYQYQDLLVAIPMSQRAASRAAAQRKAGEPVRVTAQKLVAPSRQRTSWRADAQPPVRVIEPDAELQSMIEQRSRPRVVKDATLGRLVLDRSLDWWEGKRRLDGRRYDISISTREPDDDAKVAKAIARGRAAIEHIEGSMATFRKAIVKDLWQLYEGTWRGDRRSLSRDELAKRPKLVSVQVAEGGSAVVYFSDGGLFCGHLIEVRLSARGKVSEVCLAG